MMMTNRRLLLLIALLTLLAMLLAACTPTRRGGRGDDDDDSAPDDDDDSVGTDDDDIADDDDDSVGDDDDIVDDDDDSVGDDDDATNDLSGFWFGTPTGTIDVDGNVYDCAPSDSEVELDVTSGGLASGTMGCWLNELSLLCAAHPSNVNVNAGPAQMQIDCVGEFFTVEWDTDGQSYLGGSINGTVDIGSIVTVDIDFILQR